ncbi:MAG TPA: DUF1461 domain-containing protein [Dehalococcoidia bacterium]|nr:DUF1461 domain-containing protein [Dehalococcoidia bacterium]
MKILAAITKWLFVLCLPVMLLTGSIWWAANSHWLYTSGFTKYDVGLTTGLAEPELEKAASGLIDYFNSPEEYADISVVKDGQDIELFTEEELIHFHDVKRLFRLDFRVLLGTAVYIVVFVAAALVRRQGKTAAKATLIGSGFTLFLVLLMATGALLDFDRLFLQFHLFAFTNEFWSAEGYMLLLFPGGFWYDAVIYIGVATAVAALVLATVTGSYLYIKRDLTPKNESAERTGNGKDTQSYP